MNRKKNYRRNNSSKKVKVIDRPISIRRLRILAIIASIIFLLLIARLFVLQFIDGPSLKESASRQQTLNTIISPKRGSIYDTNGKALAISENVDTISINPTKISIEKKEILAKGLSEIFNLEYNDVLEKVNSTSSIETIAKKVESDKVNELKTWMSNNKISTGINIDEDTKRYYPYSSLASSVIGFCGTDNQGLSGIESSYDNILTGRSGKIITSKDLNNS